MPIGDQHSLSYLPHHLHIVLFKRGLKNCRTSELENPQFSGELNMVIAQWLK